MLSFFLTTPEVVANAGTFPPIFWTGFPIPQLPASWLTGQESLQVKGWGKIRETPLAGVLA